MPQHFFRYVWQEGWFPFLQHAGDGTGQGKCGADLDRWCVRFSIEVKKMQSISTFAQDVNVDAMKTTTAGQNVAEAVQDSLDGGLFDHRAGYIEQGSIPAIGRRGSFTTL